MMLRWKWTKVNINLIICIGDTTNGSNKKLEIEPTNISEHSPSIDHNNSRDSKHVEESKHFEENKDEGENKDDVLNCQATLNDIDG
jgi:hypothetical protein